MATTRFDEAVAALQEAHRDEIKTLEEKLAEEKKARDASDSAASEAEDERDAANSELNDARDDVKQLLEDKENLLRLVGMTEHEYDSAASKLRWIDPKAFIIERLSEMS